ncbi:carboxylating nicotinate-nucleotide diphosphorylase [Arenibaculum sp.]|jgi:nicotinate-nucleotide pyrophosphorylase (carboxylating)|uniref:carboxylating nicotinate-nucleotide diphosphorylase n=1 Tax=Arenibaculum sp. TaxID=2865862 RepID=UPI002E1372FC|nr:carboxylating nicotinate-nucleotide diphosphorylase [Arenibaculum sp.]
MLYPLMYEPVVRAALAEDLGCAGDLTTDAAVPADARAVARFSARGAGRVAGLDAALSAFRMLDPALAVEPLLADGADVPAGGVLAVVSGAARPILTGERTALNLLGRLCGIATATRALVEAVAGTRARIACTRKTTPGLRALEKHAVRMGGGANHRFGLDDAVLVKDNHIVAAGGLGPALERLRSRLGHMVRIEVEVDTLDQLEILLRDPVDAVLLDNMDPQTLRRAVAMVGGRMITEASGNVTPETVRAIAESGVDMVSVGWITHSAPNLDIGLDFEPG